MNDLIYNANGLFTNFINSEINSLEQSKIQPSTDSINIFRE